MYAKRVLLAIVLSLIHPLGCGPRSAPQVSNPSPIEDCFVPTEQDDIFVLSAGISVHEPGPDFLVVFPTRFLEEGGDRVPRDLRASFFSRNRTPQTFPEDVQLALNGKTTVLAIEDVPSYFSVQEWDDLLNYEYNARYVHQPSLPGYSCDGTRAAVYIEHNCGDLCAKGWFYLMANVDGIWIEFYREQWWIS